MYNFTFKMADSKFEDLKPAVIVQVQAENLTEAKTKIATDFTGMEVGTLIGAQEIKEIDSE